MSSRIAVTAVGDRARCTFLFRGKEVTVLTLGALGWIMFIATLAVVWAFETCSVARGQNVSTVASATSSPGVTMVRVIWTSSALERVRHTVALLTMCTQTWRRARTAMLDIAWRTSLCLGIEGEAATTR